MYFLQISDTHHLHHYESTKDFFHDAFCNLHPAEEKIAMLARQLKEELPVPLDFICHCGDVTHAGSKEDYLSAKRAYETNFPQIPFLVTAGNHDKRDLLQEVFFGEKIDFFVQDTQVQDLRILSFDNSNGAPNSGEITEKTCKWLLERLEEQPHQPTILMSHHHVLPQQSPMPTVVSHPLFSQVLQQKNILAYFTGHTHSPYVGTLEQIPYYTVGSFCFSATDLGKGLLDVYESTCYHLFSYEKGSLTLVKSGSLGLEGALSKVQKPVAN